MRALVIAVVLASAAAARAGDPHGHVTLDPRAAPIVEAHVFDVDLPGSPAEITLRVDGQGGTPATRIRGIPDQRDWRATFDISKLAVFDGEKHLFFVETDDGVATNQVALRFSPAGAPLPDGFELRDVGPPPGWIIALCGLAELAMLVIAYFIALREPRPADEDPSPAVTR
jgi:hypothetical protein